jgi:hypothetical protein
MHHILHRFDLDQGCTTCGPRTIFMRPAEGFQNTLFIKINDEKILKKFKKRKDKTKWC